jgi:hypothetical protein
MSAIRVTAEALIPKYVGDVQDYVIQWTGRIAPARVTATSGTGAWALAGETGSAFTVYPASGLTGSAISLAQYWTAYNSASGAGLTATGSASAVYFVEGRFRISGGSASVNNYACSAELRTSSGRFLYERFHIQIGS